MRSNLTLCVAAIALGFGIAGAAAASIDPALQSKGTDETNSLVSAEGTFRAGFSALKANQGSSLKEAESGALLGARSGTVYGLVRPEGVWAEGLAAVSTGYLSKSAVSGIGLQQAAMTAHDPQATNPRGLAALKAGSSQHGHSSQDLQSLRSQAVGPEVSNLLTAPSK